MVIGSLLNNAFANLREAWSPVAEIAVEKIGSEVNPHFASIVSPTEIVVVTRFNLDCDAPVEVRALLGHTTIALSALMSMRAGDVLANDFNGQLTLLAEDVPMFSGALGLSHGEQAVKIGDPIQRSKTLGAMLPAPGQSTGTTAPARAANMMRTP